MSALIGISIGLTLMLAVYAAGHAVAALAFWRGRRAPRLPAGHPTDAVAVLIPARNEGDAALRVFESLLRQDHHGRVDAYLLINDSADTSVPVLEATWPDFATRDAQAVVVPVATRGKVTVWVAFTGTDPKHAKVNWMLDRIEAPWTAILDCDHQAHPNWLRSATHRLNVEGAKAVQGRRYPISADGLFQLWDALHQHVGCEVFNVAWRQLGRSVFLTGTTLVVDTALLQRHRLRSCITEDTDLSYRLFLEGTKIVADPDGGSDEEVSPDLYSFFARRRRWANGHSETFLEHLKLLRAAPISRLAKLQFVFHGLHYLMAVPVFALHLVLGVVYATRLQPSTGLWALGLSLTLGLLGARTQRASKKRRWLSEVGVLTAWYGPAVVIALNVATAALLDDWARIALPWPEWVQIVGLLGLLTPLFVLLMGLAGFGQLGVSTFVTVVLTYPVAFYLDLSGVLIGLMDLVFGRHLWLKVARATHAPEDPEADATLAPVHGIRESWRPGPALAWVGRLLAMAAPRLKRPLSLAAWALVLGAVGGGAVYSYATRVPIERASCTALTHDTDPWIVTPDRLDGTGYCETEPTHGPDFTRRMSRFEVVREDQLSPPSPDFWTRQDATFFCNEAHFVPENVLPAADGGVDLVLKPEAKGDRRYTAADLVTVKGDEALRYGRYEVVMKPAKVSGTISAFFLYRFDPWQEIDTEFLGKDTTKIMLNVFYNPGDEGDLYNYGFAGTPVIIDLGFDAADDFHAYAVEWDEDEIRWFVDGRLIHARPAGRPTPIPHLPMQLHLNFWPSCSEQLVGPLDTSKLPAKASFRSVTLSRRVPNPLARVWAWYDDFWLDEPEARWQDRAAWIHDRKPVAGR